MEVYSEALFRILLLLVVVSLSGCNVKGALEESLGADNDRVMFPGPTSRTKRDVKPDECEHEGYCDNPPNYPEELVSKLMDKIGGDLKNLEIDPLYEAAELEPIPTEVSLCTSKTTIIHPRSAKDNNGQWHWIVNPKNKPMQGFIAELCEKSDAPCNSIFTVPAGYKSVCMQKYLLRVAQAVKEGNDSTYKVQVKLPSTCSCTVIKS